LAEAFDLVETVDAGGGFLGDAFQIVGDGGPFAGVGGEFLADGVEDDSPLFRVVLSIEVGDVSGFFKLGGLHDEECGIATVIDDEVRAGFVFPCQCAKCALPVFFECFTLPCEDGNAFGVFGCSACLWSADDDSGGSVVLS